MQSNFSSPVRIFNEYLDLLRFPQPDQQRKLGKYLHLKYADRKPDLIICISLPAFSFLKQFGSSALQAAPRVLIMSETEGRLMDPAEARQLSGTVLFDIDFSQTLNFALKIQPNTRRAVVGGGDSSYDRFRSTQFQKEGRAFKPLRFASTG